MSTSRSFHLSVPVELSLKSPRVGNPEGGGTDAVASALGWSTKSVRLSICVSIFSGNPMGAVRVLRCNIYLEKKEIMINSRWRQSSRFDKFRTVVVCALMFHQNSRWGVLMLR